MKILWVGDAVITSGFAVVTHNICNELALKCDVVVFGIGYNGRTRHEYPYHIYPGRNNLDLYSFDYLVEVVKAESPDVIILFNDDHIIREYLMRLSGVEARIITLLPVNYLPISKLSMFSYLPFVSEILTYTDFARDEVAKIIPTIPTKTVYHGVHSNIFYPIRGIKAGQEDETKQFVSQFIVGNIGTNTYRKRIDLFLQAFSMFANGKSDVQCLLHYTNLDTAYNCEEICNEYGITNKVLFSNKSVTFEKLNAIYNLIDVNVNTSMGEGFGLTSLEGAACGNAIMVPNHGNFRDIWQDSAVYITPARVEHLAGTNFLGEVIDVYDLAKKLDAFYYDRTLLASYKQKAYNRSHIDQFKWSVVSEKVYQSVKRVTASRLVKVEVM